MSNSDKKDRNILTVEGHKKLMAELEERQGKTREEIANKLEIATEQGDLSENAAYKAALEEKEMNEAQIQEIEETLRNAEVVEEDKSDPSVGMGDKVTLEDTATGDKQTFTIVSSSESDPVNGKISMESPVGSAVYGKDKGDKVTVNLPHKKVEYKIVKVN